MITVTAHGRASVLQIDRPERRNALDTDTCNQLRQGLQDSVQGGALAVVITGQGSSFCSGADLSGVYGDEFLLALRTMLSAITDAPVPVIAAVNGPAIGAGTQLAVACDLRVAAPTAGFGVPTSQLGLAAEAFTLRRLALFAGGGAARRMMLAAQRLDVTEAAACGLVDVEGDLDDATALAQRIATLAPMSVAYSKRVLNTVADVDDDWAEAGFLRCWTSADFAEGQLARKEKRPPIFQGR